MAMAAAVAAKVVEKARCRCLRAREKRREAFRRG